MSLARPSSTASASKLPPNKNPKSIQLMGVGLWSYESEHLTVVQVAG